MKVDPTTRESLQAEAEVDPMEGEQTWPTESELLEAEGADTHSSPSSFINNFLLIIKLSMLNRLVLTTDINTLTRFCLLFRGQEEQTSHEGP